MAYNEITINGARRRAELRHTPPRARARAETRAVGRCDPRRRDLDATASKPDRRSGLGSGLGSVACGRDLALCF
jgi:hypothetical protein